MKPTKGWLQCITILRTLWYIFITNMLLLAWPLNTVNTFILESRIFSECNVQVHPFNLPIFKLHKILQCFHEYWTLTCQWPLQNQNYFFYSKYTLKCIHAAFKWFKNIYSMWRSNLLIMMSYPCILAYFTIYWWYIMLFHFYCLTKDLGFAYANGVLSRIPEGFCIKVQWAWINTGDVYYLVSY